MAQAHPSPPAHTWKSDEPAPSPTVAVWIELSRKYKQNMTGPRVLPIAELRGTYYFVDERLHQLRNIADPADFIDFETDGDMLIYIATHGRMVS